MGVTGKKLIPFLTPLGLLILFIAGEIFTGAFNPYTAASNYGGPNPVRSLDITLASAGGENFLPPADPTAWKNMDPDTFAKSYTRGTYWVRVNLDPSFEFKANRTPFLFLSGLFTAQILQDGELTNIKGISEYPLTSTPFTKIIPLEMKRDGILDRSFILKLDVRKQSRFISPPVQVIAINDLVYSDLQVRFLTMIIGIIFLGLVLQTILFGFASGRKSLKSPAAGPLFLSSGALLLAFLFWTSTDLNVANIEFSIFIYLVFLAVGACPVFTVLEKQKENTATIQVLFILTVVALMLFGKKLYLTHLGIQFAFYGFVLFYFYQWKQQGKRFPTLYTGALAVYPLLVIFSPHFTANYAPYFFALGLMLPHAADQAKELFKPGPKKEIQFLDVFSTGERHLINVNDIKILKAVDHYTEIILTDGNRLVHQHTLADVLKKLPDNFIRIHRSHAVRTEDMQKMHSKPGSRYFVTLKNGEILPVGRKFVPDVRKVLV